MTLNQIISISVDSSVLYLLKLGTYLLYYYIFIITKFLNVSLYYLFNIVIIIRYTLDFIYDWTTEEGDKEKEEKDK